jgi:hypothetical protein
LTTISPPPPEDAPYAERLRYFKGWAYLPPSIVSAPGFIRSGAAWLLEHGEIDQTEHDRLVAAADAEEARWQR